eukprot:scaffold6807_cov220-Amphora_coffeaeformis.AAC.3
MIDLQVLQQQQYAAPPPVQLKPVVGAPAPSEPVKPAASPKYPTEDGVGRGTLLFATQVMLQQHQAQSRNTSPTMGSALSSPPPPPPRQRISPPDGGGSFKDPTPPATLITGLLNKQLSEKSDPLPYPTQIGHFNLNSYGATDEAPPPPPPLPADRRMSSLSDDGVANPNVPTSNTNNNNNHQPPLQQANIYHMEGIPPLDDHQNMDQEAQAAAHSHDFHYGGEYDDYYERPPRSTVARYCCCLMYPIMGVARWLCLSEELHRSACLGAIDGLVTGASLVAALYGLQVWTPLHSAEAVRVWLLAVSTAVAAAEALCMAAGHVRTVQQHALLAWQSRQEVTLEVQTNRAAAKGHLVDLLLQRGLLKIDAMSIADTLEGYPDVCVSLLAGEGLDAPQGAGSGLSGDNMAALLHGHVQPDWHHYDELDDPEGNGSNSRVVRKAVSEAWTEAVGMMFGFGIAAIVPALVVWRVLPAAPTSHQEFSYVTSSFHDVPDHAGSEQFMEPTTLLALVLSLIMLVLGWLKAFLTSSTSYFSTIIEGILLLWLSLGTAYGMGAALRHAGTWPHYLLTVATDKQTQSYCV